MVSSADATLESLIDEVNTNNDEYVDTAEAITKSDTTPKLSLPKVLEENSKDERRKNKKKHHKEKKQKHRKKSRESQDEGKSEIVSDRFVSESEGSTSKAGQETQVEMEEGELVEGSMVVDRKKKEKKLRKKKKKEKKKKKKKRKEDRDIREDRRESQSEGKDDYYDRRDSRCYDYKNSRRKRDSRDRDDKRRHGRERSRDPRNDDYHRTSERRSWSRSRSPSVGRGRNIFHRTDEEWREYKRDRIRRRVSPVQIYEEDYTDNDGKVDKKKLMNIATKNVTKLAISGALPKGYELLTTIKNKTVTQLIALCKKLHDEDERARADRPSSSSGDSVDEEKFYGCASYWEEDRSFSIREPKEASAPKYEVIDGVVKQVRTVEERRTAEAILQVSYPVSSGYEHRMKEPELVDDDIPQLCLMNALAKIKTNIPPAFGHSFGSDIKGLVGPDSRSKSVTELPKKLSSVTNAFPNVPLPKFIEDEKPLELPSANSEPVAQTVVHKPIKIRASFLKSGKKAAEEALNKIMVSTPTPVPAPNVSQGVKEVTSLLPIAVSPSVPPSLSMTTEESQQVSTTLPEEAEKKEITHSDHLSALLDKVDELVSSGRIEEVSKVEKKELPKDPEPIEEIQTGNYVKIPGSNELEKTKDKEYILEKPKKNKKRKSTKKDAPEKSTEVDENGGKKMRKKHESREKGAEPKEKKRKSELPAEVETLTDLMESQKSSDFNYRDPLPFIKALTNPQLAITAIPTDSLKATWNDSKNMPAFASNEESMSMPFKIGAPKEIVVNSENMVFKPSKPINNPPKTINELVSKRALFVQALMANPDDYHAKSKIAEIDQEMSAWAESKNIPGKYTGRTGARVLSADELGPSDPRYHAWARKDLFLNAPEHESEFGRRILEKYGWQKGSGLGKTLAGPVTPLSLDIKADRRGLAASTDRKPGKNSLIADINGKNPISLVMEYCAKRKLQPPTFTCIESGPANSRRFLWKCVVDGVEYMPSMPAANKKTGKTEVCYVILQALGQIPPMD